VIDPVGGDRVTDSLRSLAPEGRLVVAGFSGEIPVVKVNRLLLGDTGVLGAASREFSEQQPVTVAGLWDRLLRLWRARRCPILPFSATRSPTPAAPCARSLTAKPRARFVLSRQTQNELTLLPPATAALDQARTDQNPGCQACPRSPCIKCHYQRSAAVSHGYLRTTAWPARPPFAQLTL
jgi:hypothetical protein